MDNILMDTNNVNSQPLNNPINVASNNVQTQNNTSIGQDNNAMNNNNFQSQANINQPYMQQNYNQSYNSQPIYQQPVQQNFQPNYNQQMNKESNVGIWILVITILAILCSCGCCFGFVALLGI